MDTSSSPGEPSGLAGDDRTVVTVVVPVFDEVEALPGFHSELVEASHAWRVDGGTPVELELVYVDDGSTDGTSELLEKIHLDAPELVRVVTLRRNFGKAAALAAGFDAARGDVLVTLDADGQDVPAEVQKLLDRLDAGCDVVAGWRRSRNDRRMKRWTSRAYNATTRWLTGLDLHDFNTGLKAYRREVVEEMPMYGELHRFVPVLAHDLGFSVGEVEVHHRPRQAGTSKYLSVTRFPKTLLDLLTVLFLTRFADRPLHLFGGIGLAMSALGGAFLVYLSLYKVITGDGIGQRPLLLFGILLVLLGGQLVGIGFLGDVIRHSTARRETPYRVRRTLP